MTAMSFVSFLEATHQLENFRRTESMIKRLTGTIQTYAWGSRTMIPELLGLPPTGEPQAELWLGAHPMAPSLVEGRQLDQLVAENPAGVMGARPYANFGPRLPFLMKIIAADRPLSLQAHPSRAQAEAGFAEEESAGIPVYASNRTYRDTWPKPEVLCALGPTEALCGFRDPAETYRLFEQFGAPGTLPIVRALNDGSRDPKDRLKEVFRRLLRLSGGERAVIHQVAGVADSFRGSGPVDSLAATIRAIPVSWRRSG